MFGWGLILVALGFGLLIWMLFAETRTLFRHWNRILGSIALGLTAFGALAFFRSQSGVMAEATLGGNFGQSVIGAADTEGILRVVGLALLGTALVAPPFVWHVLKASAIGIAVGCRYLPTMIGKIYHSFTTLIPRRAPQRESQRELPLEITSPSPVTEMPPPNVSEELTPSSAGTPTTAKSTLKPTTPTGKAQQEEPKKAVDELLKLYGEEGLAQYLPNLSIEGWQLPPIHLLNTSPLVEFSQADAERRARLIEEALASYNVEARVDQINVGPTVTQFGVEPGWDRKYKEVKERDENGNITVSLKETSKTRVKVERITSLANDLALSLATPSIRMEAPVPGKSVVGIEVPNSTLGLVSLRELIESASFQKLKSRSKLALALGKGAGGETVAGDLSKMPHLLIAGATGSGKTVCLNSIIACLLMQNTPDELQLLLVDPKRVELTPFNTIPHLTTPVIVTAKKAVATLKWLSREMDERYHKLAAAGARNIEDYNKNREGGRLPYMILVIDELADLMMADPEEVESGITRLAQMARATGIHLVIATQRPSVDVVTGLIKANFPTRISFAVASQIDSRTILDSAGAERLLGRGDMLYLPTEASKPKRLQGCFVSDNEIDRLVHFWSSQRAPHEKPQLVEDLSLELARGEEPTAEDPLLEQARQLACQHKQISTSFLQRRLRIGYPRAARLMDLLEEEKGVEPDNLESPPDNI
jgi:S-DNA-T family DNA segregation ATPase FtsK/SpoIIIE